MTAVRSFFVTGKKSTIKISSVVRGINYLRSGPMLPPASNGRPDFSCVVGNAWIGGEEQTPEPLGDWEDGGAIHSCLKKNRVYFKR
jgi:hypothetical protein